MPAQSPEQFAAHLARAAIAAPAAAVKVVGKGAFNIKTEGKANALQAAPTHNAGAPRTITYDTPEVNGTVVESEIGYDLRVARAAYLGNLLEYGGGGDHSPPHRDLGRALDNEAPKFAAAIATAAGRLL